MTTDYATGKTVCTPCDDPGCSVCDESSRCQTCQAGYFLTRRPPKPEEEVATDKAPPQFDAAGWEVEEEVAKDDWPQVCSRCSASCLECTDPSPTGCTRCFPLSQFVPGEGCKQSLQTSLGMAAFSLAIFAVGVWISRRNWRKFQAIRQKRAANAKIKKKR